jgi:K+-sensing histidine kinase KdpD
VSVGAAIRISSLDEERVIRRASAYAAQEQLPCFIIAVVDELPYGRDAEDLSAIVRSNLAMIEEVQATPVMQEGNDVPRTLLAAARGFGVKTLFLQSGTARLLGRSIAEQLIYLDPPFDVVVVSSEGNEAVLRGADVSSAHTRR